MDSSDHTSIGSSLEMQELESELEAEQEARGPLLGDGAGPSVGPARPPPPPLPSPPPPPPNAAWPPLLRQGSRPGRGRRGSPRPRPLKGPLRAIRLFLLALVLPCLLIAGPLYLRFHVYADESYPLAMSDMRLLDGRVSTTWCQRQVVRANATFNAFLLAESPRVAPEPSHVAMVRELLLEDDMKEFWGFYLLRGSVITVSSCVRWPGASLIVIRGHRHLHDCAYIGDNSSEEPDEKEAATAVRAAAAEAAEAARASAGAGRPSAESNEPRAMRRARPGVQLKGREPLASQERIAADSDPEPDGGALKHILSKVAQKRAWAARRRLGIVGGEGVGMENRQDMDDREGQEQGATSDDRARRRQPPSSAEVLDDVLKKLRALGPRGLAVLRLINTQMVEANGTAREVADPAPGATARAGAALRAAGIRNAPETEEGTGPTRAATTEGLRGAETTMMTETTAGTAPEAANPAGVSSTGSPEAAAPTFFPSGPVGTVDNASADPVADLLTDPTTDPLTDPAALSALRELVRQMMREHQEEVERERSRRSPWMLGAAVDEDETANAALEEDEEEQDVPALQPDGIADHHERINETEAGDLDSSNSEFWSSFSSSEEKLLSCSGLVLNLPLHPHHQCRADASPATLDAASAHNTLTYRIPTNGYYFFVFSSENEIQTNYVRAHFHLERVVYNVSSPVAACHNSTEPCALPLGFFSSEKLVLEMPVRPNVSLWNEEFLVVSHCEPRTALYVACIVSVPLLFMIFAFQ